MPDGALRPVALRYVRAGWVARLVGRSRRLRTRRSIFHRARAFGERWKGRIELLGQRATLALALRRRPIVRVPLSGTTAFTRLTTYLDRHFHKHDHLRTATQRAAEHRATPSGQRQTSRDARASAAVEARSRSALVVRREQQHFHRSQVTEVRRTRVIEGERLEARIAHHTALAEVVAPGHGVLPTVDVPRMVLRSAPRAEAGDAVMSRDPRIVDVPAQSRPATTVASAPKVEVDIERLTDQVLWRIERRVIAQRERMGKG